MNGWITFIAVHIVLLCYLGALITLLLVSQWLYPIISQYLYLILVGGNTFFVVYVLLEGFAAILIKAFLPPRHLRVSHKDRKAYASRNKLPYETNQIKVVPVKETIRSHKFQETFKPRSYHKKYFCTLVIAAYLPNEKEIIMETLHHFLNNVVIPCDHTIVLAYNSPKPLPIEEELKALEAQLKGKFRAVKVRQSTSKAENVNYILDNLNDKYSDTHLISVFDADHHPYPDAIVNVIDTMESSPKTCVIQGRCIIRNNRESFIASMVDVEFDMIYNVFHIGFNAIHSHGLFGGSNGHWRAPVISALRMDHGMLTEDIDLSVRTIANNFHVTYDHRVRSNELAPTTLSQYVKQRSRWAQGWFQVTIQRSGWAMYHARNWWIKLGILFFLNLRELSFHFQTWLTCLTAISLYQRPTLNYFIIVPITANVLFFIILVSAARHKWQSLVFFILFVPYMYLQGYIAICAEIKEFFAINKWVVTSRSPGVKKDMEAGFVAEAVAASTLPRGGRGNNHDGDGDSGNSSASSGATDVNTAGPSTSRPAIPMMAPDPSYNSSMNPHLMAIPPIGPPYPNYQGGAGSGGMMPFQPIIPGVSPISPFLPNHQGFSQGYPPNAPAGQYNPSAMMAMGVGPMIPPPSMQLTTSVGGGLLPSPMSPGAGLKVPQGQLNTPNSANDDFIYTEESLKRLNSAVSIANTLVNQTTSPQPVGVVGGGRAAAAGAGGDERSGRADRRNGHGNSGNNSNNERERSRSRSVRRDEPRGRRSEDREDRGIEF